jgi:hypothetical protein
MLILIKTGITAGLVALLSLSPWNVASAAEIDFSCMNYKVWPKRHLSDRYREYDIVLQNNCPGAVYWSMCIERIDSDTNQVWETLTPSGFVEPEKKARVNLQTKRNDSNTTFRQRYEEFYVNIGYAVDDAATADCHAKRCESKKSDLRASVRANAKAWEEAEKALSAKIANDCPDSGWDTATRQKCSVDLRESSREQLSAFSARDAQLRKEMAAIDPDHCTAWSGDLVSE